MKPQDTITLPAWLVEEAELQALHDRLVECTKGNATLADVEALAQIRAAMADRGMAVPA